MRRFFVPAIIASAGERLTLDDASARHARVLRLARGTEIAVVDEQGGSWRGRIVELDRRGAIVEVVERTEDPGVESPLRLTLAQGLARGAKMEEVIRHGCELGVSAIVPLLCARSTWRSGNVERWRAIARDAARQSGRAVCPPVADILAFDEFVATPFAAHKLLLALPGPDAIPLPHAITEVPPGAEVALLVGPEGGLPAEERQAALDAGYVPVSMGPRVLRTETAALAAAAALQATLGDWE